MDKQTGILTPDKDDSQPTNELEVLAENINNQQIIVQQMIQIKKEIENQEKRIDQKITRTENLVDKISKQVTINYDEQRELQSLVNRKAQEMAKIHEGLEDEEFSDNLFKAWKGLFIRRVYQKLKAYMNVVRYTAIQREKYERSMEFIESIEYQDFSCKELSPTPSIIRIKKQEA